MSKGKILAVIMAVAVLSAVSAYADDVRIGVLAKAGMTEEEFTSSVSSVWKWSTIEEIHSRGENKYYFYDTINSMILAAQRGDIDEIELPRAVAEFAAIVNPGYKIGCVLGTTEADFVFGFMNDDKGKELQNKFNAVLEEIKVNGILEGLHREYIINAGQNELRPLEFTPFDGAATIRVAITGDVPPIDYIAPNDQAMGFNVALLSEIGRELGVNIELVEVDAIARTPALTSGRVDVVFWYQFVNGVNEQHDIPEEVIVSDPYYKWDTFVHVRKSNAEDDKEEEEEDD